MLVSYVKYFITRPSFTDDEIKCCVLLISEEQSDTI
jgi:hypothetical protein